MKRFIRQPFIRYTFILLLGGLFLLPAAAHAQTGVTPTVFCLGSCPADPTPTERVSSGAMQPKVVAEDGEPTTDPCAITIQNQTQNGGTVSVQTYGHEHRESGSISGFVTKLLQLLTELLRLIQQIIGGGDYTIPESPTGPQPTTDPEGNVPTTGDTQPTINPCLTQEPTQPGTAQPTTAPDGDTPVVSGDTPVGINGQLQVCGTKLCNQFNQPIQLRGVSTHGLQWHYNCVNDSAFTALADEWKADVVRIAMYVDEGGYTTDPAGFRQKVDEAVELATAKGMYVLIDWHILNPGNPNVHVDEAKEFFDYMSKKHASKNNIFYEIANEPNGVSWGEIKNYANEVIPVIRANDPTNIIIVGTPGFSSMNLVGGNSTDVVTGDPVDGENLMYAFHFYAASHHDEWRNPIAAAADKLPIFATEWGTPTYTGDGGLDLASAQQWLDMFADKGISWASWNFSDDGQTGALLNGGSCPNGPWDNLKESGNFVKQNTLNPADNFPTN